MTRTIAPDLTYLFEPRSVAIVGASRDEFKSGGMFISAMLKDGYTGKIIPINRKESEIMGLKCYPAIADVPDDIDLAVMAIPAQATVAAIEDCARKGVKFAVVHAVGFSELDVEGKELEKKMVETARRGDVRIIGPNCMGIFTPRGRVNTIVPYSRVPLEPGGVALVCQSGWVAEIMMRLGSARGLRFSGIISIGNQSDLTMEDLIEYWGNDPGTEVIGAYIEGLKDARRFMQVAQRVALRKPLIIWKGGRSEMGVRAAASHTGSMAGSWEIFRAMCRQKGITPAYGMEDLIDLLVAFSSPVLPAGNELGLLIEAGGGGVASSDACAREGLKITPFPRDVQEKLAAYLKDVVPPSNNRKNPVDLVWAPIGKAEKVYADCLEIVMPWVDVCLVMTYAFLHDEWFRTRLAEMRDRLKKPIILIPANPADQLLGLPLAVQSGLPSYVMPENAVRCISAMLKRRRYLEERK